MKKALITGITGQDGSYLAEHLIEKGYEVHGVKRRSSSFNTGRIEHLYADPRTVVRPNMVLHYGDLVDTCNIVGIIAKVKPDEIYNLGAQSHVQVSFETPEYTANADALGALRILEAIRNLGLEDSTKFYQASTSEIFGGQDTDALNENSRINPRSPYGAAKAYAHWMVRTYREAYGLFAVNGILFNHESPRRGETFVTQKIVKGLVRIKYGLQKALYLGNIYSVRDWGHAKDYVEAMRLMLQQTNPDDYVIATGTSYSVKEFIIMVAQALNMELEWSGNNINEQAVWTKTGGSIIKIDPSHYRPTEVNYLRGDYSKAKRELNWSPKITINQLIDEMVKAELPLITNE